ncbi:MAG: D-aminoacylase [Fibrella sp.]|nr:D-aminoacylase [Armatimonadota bacterium]
MRSDLPSSDSLLPTRFDSILRGGTVFDGSGADGVVADVGIVAGNVAAIGDLSRSEAGEIFDVRGKFVAPGFIDIHTHSDFTLLSSPGMESSVAQGVTTEIVGNCGIALGLAQIGEQFTLEQRGLLRAGISLDWTHLDGFLARVADTGIGANIATLAGHGTIRKRVMGLADRLPDARELADMERELETAFRDGAVGLSSGLEYVPGMYADVAELTAMAKVAKRAGGFYATHLRDEGDHLEEAVAEALAVAEGAGLPLQLSHHKAERRANWGKVTRTLAMVDAAQARGVDVLLDQYPYTAYQTSLATIALPPWAVAGSPEAQAAKLADPTFRAKTREAMQYIGVDFALVQISNCPGHREYQGRMLSDIAADENKDVRDVILDTLGEGEGWVSAAHFALSEADVARVLSDDRVMIGSDGVATSPTSPGTSDRPHPRTYGTFARIFGRYVREQGVLTWAQAICRMTSLPAQRIGLTGRGTLMAGCVADVAVFDPETVGDVATFDTPHAYADGVELVFVGGALAVRDGILTGVRSGAVLRRGGDGTVS